LVQCCPQEGFGGWDYSCESPRADLRGFVAERLQVDPEDARWDDGQPSRSDRELRADWVLLNGGRLYNDHGHPEYATPECSRLLDLVAADRAGELLVEAAARELEAKLGRRVRVYKNNTDFHGATYGTHENYLAPRSLQFGALFRGLTPLLVARQLLCGAGKVGSEVGKPVRFQLSQRADFLTEEASVDTLYRRPVFNTRDEPHADPTKWQRVHVICGDANRMDWATAMKVGMLVVGIRLVEMGEAPGFELCSAAAAFASISRDERMQWRVQLQGPNWTTAVEILDSYLSAAERLLLGQDAETDWVLSEWRLALSDLGRDPMSLRDRVDWAAKLSMLQVFSESEGGWREDAMQSLDLEYGNLQPNEGLYDALRDSGATRQLVDDHRIQEAASHPPRDTRAWVRSELVRRYSDQLAAIGWRRAVFAGEPQKAMELDLELASLCHSGEGLDERIAAVRASQ
jgi:hypothetical protein